MSVGILGAMPEEVDILRAEMTDVISEKFAAREYYTGMLYGVKTTLVFSRWGKVASAIAATTLLTKYHVDKIIFVGVAGAIHDELNIGDVVIADQLYQHDMDARPLFPQFEIPLTGYAIINTDTKLCSEAERAAKSFCLKGIRETIPSTILAEFLITNPMCYKGMIASGDSFVASATQRAAIKAGMPGVLAVEMEGAAIAQVCSEHGIPFVVVRIISDKADHSAQIDFPRFIAEIAKHYSKNIIKSMYEKMIVKKNNKIETSVD